jgi:hypothetical protein
MTDREGTKEVSVVKTHHQNWVRRVEHVVLRIVSMVFSLVSAHAILWFFSALDWVDTLQPFVKWGIALGFGILGYFVSRGLAHRLLNKERVTAYVFICGVFELVEIVCNYSMAAASASSIGWLSRVHGVQFQVLTFLVYVVLSIIPVVTVMLAWVDMDLERAKQGYAIQGFGLGMHGAGTGANVPSVGVPPRPVPSVQPQPKMTGYAPNGHPTMAMNPPSSYAQGYAPAPALAPAVAPAALSSSVSSSVPAMTQGQAQGQQRGWLNNIPLVGRWAAPQPQPQVQPKP